jgi:hypothetical protein
MWRTSRVGQLNIERRLRDRFIASSPRLPIGQLTGFFHLQRSSFREQVGRLSGG